MVLELKPHLSKIFKNKLSKPIKEVPYLEVAEITDAQPVKK
jgi:hypothetical protein